MLTRTSKMTVAAAAVAAVVGLAAPKAEAGHYSCGSYPYYARSYYRPVYVAPPVYYAPPVVSYYRPTYVAPAYYPPVYRSYAPVYHYPRYYRPSSFSVGFGYGRHHGHSHYGGGFSFGVGH